MSLAAIDVADFNAYIRTAKDPSKTLPQRIESAQLAWVELGLADERLSEHDHAAWVALAEDADQAIAAEVEELVRFRDAARAEGAADVALVVRFARAAKAAGLSAMFYGTGTVLLQGAAGVDLVRSLPGAEVQAERVESGARTYRAWVATHQGVEIQALEPVGGTP